TNSVMTDADFPNWDEFQHAHEDKVTCGPTEMLRAITERLQPWLASLCAHAPFLLAIKAEPANEVPYLIYADWLQDRADSRGDFLRLFIRWYFYEDPDTSVGHRVHRLVQRLFQIDESTEELTDIRQALKLALQKTSTPWLYHLFGSPARFREFKQKIEA